MTGYRPDIDGLRAFSILAVVIYHAFPAALPGGFVGVDVFFVISGYLITGIILRQQSAASFTLSGFYRRRIQRILPALLLVLAACLAIGWWVLLPYEYAVLGKQTLAASVFAPNILFWTEAGYFDTDSRLKPLLHLWSLGVEEQFYLAWPLLLVLTARLRLTPLLVVSALIVASFSLGLLHSGDPASAFFLPQFRIWELLLGAALATLPNRGTRGAMAGAISLAGLLMMIAATVLISSNSDFPGWWALLPTAGAALVIAGGAASPINRALGLPLLVFIGKISFPLYLWHWPLLTFARIMESGEPAPGIRLGAVLLSALLAWLSYRLVETPLRYHPGRRVPALLLAGLLLCGGLGLGIMAAQGIPSRAAMSNEAATALYWKELDLHRRDDCSAQLGVPGRCLSDGKPAKVAVIGDSHSSNTFFALARYYRDNSGGVLRLGKGGCPPLYEVEVRDSGRADICRAVTRGNLDWVMATTDITTVYLSSMGPMYLKQENPRYRMHYPLAPELDSNGAIFSRALDDTVALLQQAGKEVVLVIDWPGLGFHPRECVDIRPLRLTAFEPRQCRIPRKRYDRINREYRDILTGIAARHPEVKLWDTTTVFCDQRYCYGMREGELLYRDPGHLSLGGSNYLGERLQLSRPGAH